MCFPLLRNNLPFVITLIILILVLGLLVFTYQRKKFFKKESNNLKEDLNNSKNELLSYQEYDDNFDEELDDGTKIKSGSEIQMKHKPDKLIAISFNKKTKMIKYIIDGIEKEAHINLFKKYKWQGSVIL